MHKTSLRGKLTAAFVLAAAAMVAGPAAAEFPTKPIRFIIPNGPGTSVDLVGRFIAERMQAEFKSPVVVENRPGGSGVIGADAVAKSRPDGYTLAYTGATFLANQFLVKQLPYDPVADFKPVARIASLMVVLVVPSNSPIRSVQDLIQDAKNRPGKVHYASSGNGSPTHLAAALLGKAANIGIVHVPYKSTAQQVTDIMSGQVNMGFMAITTAKPHLGTRLRAIAVSGLQRSKSLPDVPTIAEAGLPGFELVTWNGFFAPAETPTAIINQLAEAAIKAARSQEFTELMSKQGLDPSLAGPDEFAATLPTEREHCKEVIKASGLGAK